jgi:hypothetical protein
VKTAIMQYLLRSDSTAVSYQEIKDSLSVVQFGKRHLSKPGKRADLKERIFLNQNPQDVLQKKEADKKKPEDGKTIAGISSRFEYICKVGNILHRNMHSTFKLFRQMEGSCGAGFHVSVQLASIRSGMIVIRKIWLAV